MTPDLTLNLVPSGFGFRKVGGQERHESYQDLFNLLLIFEPPRPRDNQRYLVAADISDGIGKDRTSIDVIRLPTIDEPTEQVAHFVTDSIVPRDAAYIVDSIGHFYADRDKYEAMVVIELNNHGLSTQDTLKLHMGYSHFYRWEYLNKGDPKSRFAATEGWNTTAQTRPIIINHFYSAVTTLDAKGRPDLIVNSPHTLSDMADLVIPNELGATLAHARAEGEHAHDDCVISLAIGSYIAWRLLGGEHEPLDEVRRRRQEEQRVLEEHAGALVRPDFRNLPFTAEELSEGSDAMLLPDARDSDNSILFSYRGY